MESPSGQGASPFSPLLGYFPYKFLWRDSPTLRLPPHIPAPHSSQIPLPHQLPPFYALQQASFFNMLAHESAITSVHQPSTFNLHRLSPASSLSMSDLGDKAIKSTMTLSGPSRSVSTTSPVTPPLTPLLDEAATAESITLAGASAQPTRTSSRNRRPPAFIEGQSECPLCGSLLRASELEEHYLKELQNIKEDGNETQPSATRRRSMREYRTSARLNERKALTQTESRKNVFARVRHNRKSRVLKTGFSGSKRRSGQSAAAADAKSAKPSTSTEQPIANCSAQPDQTPPADNKSQTTACPVCNKVFVRQSSEEMTLHVESCLSKNSSPDNNRAAASASNNSSESDEDYETYTWCGQTRIRATTMLDSSELANAGFNAVKAADDEDDADLVVDDDMNEQKFGGAQYSEADVIPCTSEEPAEAKAQTALRQAVISLSEEKLSTDTETQSKWTDEPTIDDPDMTFKCLICMDKYSKPLVSIQCWHVHCEECWLRTLGAKKLCPQCNLITSPADLRKIYL